MAHNRNHRARRGIRDPGTGSRCAVALPIPDPQPPIPSPQPRIPNPEPRIPNPEPRIPNPEPRIPSPEPPVPNPQSPIPTLKQIVIALIVSAACLTSWHRPALAEVFVLTTGGRVEGRLLNPDESPRQQYVIQTPSGSRITLARSQVLRVLRPSAAELEYERIRPGYGDTAEAQWALAQWCLEHRLPSLRKIHLERTIELDENHEEARRALGYFRENGEWVQTEDVMHARGYVRFEGRWRVQQEVDLAEARRAAAAAEGAWMRQVKMWRGWLYKDRDADARRNLLSIKDPQAVKALATGLEEDDRPHVRILLIEALANIGTPETLWILASRALEDPLEEVRLTCLDHLQETKSPDVVAYFCRQLGHKDNAMVHRAAVGLSYMKDPASILPLIGALVTVHKYRVSQGGGPGSISPTFGMGPGGGPGPSGLSIGGRPKIIQRDIPNRAVLDTLVSLTGRNYQYDEAAWKEWYASRTRVEHVNLRRD